MSKLLLAAVTALQLLQVAVANAESDRIEPHQAFNDSSYCQFPQACDQSTPGTGHKFFRGNLTEDLITVERCYSFCFKNFSSSSGIAAHFPDIFAGDPCSANSADAFVCYAACLFSAKDALKRIFPGLSVPDNATCEHYCQLKDGICERAFPPNSDCMVQCKLETCREYCRHVMDEFPDTTEPVNSGSVSFTMDFASNITLKRQGVLEIQPTLSGATPADVGVFGLVWKVSHWNGFVAYIPQHLPFLLLPDEVGPLYRIGSNMLAIRELQCYTLLVEVAVVTQFGVGSFSSPRPQCFYGNWHPRPPAGINMTLGFSRETGNLKFEVTAETPSPDDEYVTGYGVQVLGWYDGDDVDCPGTTHDLRVTGSVDFPNKEDLHLILDNTDRVFQLFPGLSSRHVCAYWIGVYALPQKEFNAAGRPIPFRAGYWQRSYITVLELPNPTWNQTFDLERDHVAGLVDVTYTLTLTSHWKSLAILDSIEGILITQAHDNNHLVFNHFKHKITGVTPSMTRYDFLFRNVSPIKENIGSYLFHVSYTTKTAFRARGFTIKNLESFTPGVVVLPPLPPGPLRNLTFNFYLDFETNTFKGNATWQGPEMPEGKLIEYRYVLSSVAGRTIVGGTISVGGTSAATDMSEENFVSFLADLTVQDFYNFSVRAVSEWEVEGEWAVETVTQTATQPPPTDSPVTIVNFQDITTQNDLQDNQAVFTFDILPRISPNLTLGYSVQIQWRRLRKKFGGYHGSDTYYLPPKSRWRCGTTPAPPPRPTLTPTPTPTPNVTLELVGSGSFKLTVPTSTLEPGPLSISVSVSLVCLQRTFYCHICTEWRYTSQISNSIEISAKRGSLAPFEVDLKLWPKEQCFEAADAIKTTDISSILIKAIRANADDIADTSYLQVYGERYLCERNGYLSFRGVLVKLYDFLAIKNRDILHDWLAGGARHIVVADRWMNIREGACGIALTSLEAPAACGKRAGRG